MKRVYKRISIVIFVLCFVSACNHIGKYPLKVFENRSVFIDEFNNVSIIRSRGKNTIILYLYNGETKNQFFFDVDKGKLILTQTSKNVNEKLFKEDRLFEKQIILLAERKVKLMDKYNIRDVSCEFQNQGISIKVYFNSLESLLYLKDIANVKNIEWLKHLKKIKKLDEHWFYEPEQS